MTRTWRPGEVLTYRGNDAAFFTAVVVRVGLSSLVVLTPNGLLYRVWNQDDVQLDEDPAVTVPVRAGVDPLLQLRGVREAINAALRAPFDTGGIDAWRLPLPLLAGNEGLTPAARRYFQWHPWVRMRFERALGIMVEERHDRQVQVLLECWLRGRQMSALARREGRTSAAMRLAKQRGLAYLRRYLGQALDTD